MIILPTQCLCSKKTFNKTKQRLRKKKTTNKINAFFWTQRLASITTKKCLWIVLNGWRSLSVVCYRHIISLSLICCFFFPVVNSFWYSLLPITSFFSNHINLILLNTFFVVVVTALLFLYLCYTFNLTRLRLYNAALHAPIKIQIFYTVKRSIFFSSRFWWFFNATDMYSKLFFFLFVSHFLRAIWTWLKLHFTSFLITEKKNLFFVFLKNRSFCFPVFSSSLIYKF